VSPHEYGSDAVATGAVARVVVHRRGPWRQAFARFRRRPSGIVAASIVALFIVIAALAGTLAPYQAGQEFVKFIQNPQPPLTPHHLLGTDVLSRDLLTQLLFAIHQTLFSALVCAGAATAAGVAVGALAGYYGGPIDYWLMRLTDVFLSIPLLPLLLVLTAIVSATSSKAALGFGVIVVIIGGLSWPPVARLVRASFLSLREKEFCEAARALGNRDGRIIFRHLLPNAVAPIIVQGTLEVANVIILESTLSFLGFGIQPPTASWGNMLANAESNMAIAPWVAIFPGLCILVTVLAINYLGDGLRDALDPNMK